MLKQFRQYIFPSNIALPNLDQPVYMLQTLHLRFSQIAKAVCSNLPLDVSFLSDNTERTQIYSTYSYFVLALVRSTSSTLLWFYVVYGETKIGDLAQGRR